MAPKKSTPTEPTEATAAPNLPPFTGFTPIAEARTVLTRFTQFDTNSTSFAKGDLLDRGRYASATITAVYIVLGGYVVDLQLTDGSTVTLFSNAEFSADVLP